MTRAQQIQLIFRQLYENVSNGLKLKDSLERCLLVGPQYEDRVEKKLQVICDYLAQGYSIDQAFRKSSRNIVMFAEADICTLEAYHLSGRGIMRCNDILGLLAEHSDTAYQYHRFYLILEAALQLGNSLRDSFWYASRGVDNPLQTNTMLTIGLLEKNSIAYALDQSGAFSPLEIALLHKGQEDGDLIGAVRTIITDQVLAPK